MYGCQTTNPTICLAVLGLSAKMMQAQARVPPLAPSASEKSACALRKATPF
jgi:hypothetical protein